MLRMIERHICCTSIDLSICILMTKLDARRKRTRRIVERLCCKPKYDSGQRRHIKTKSVMLVACSVLKHEFFSEDIFVIRIFWRFIVFNDWARASAIVSLRPVR